MKTIKFVVEGEVQGKTYRDHVKRKAWKRGFGGYVKNLPDGSVEVVCSGDESEIDAFHKEIKEDVGAKLEDCLANVTKVSEPEEHTYQEYEYFTIKYGEINEEVAEGLASGTAHLRELGRHIEAGFNNTNSSFNSLDGKYHTISTTLKIQTILLLLILIALAVGLQIV
ncbi:MAG: acylphosphatase [Candidatus Altiarchaeota archaeon]|nr:acylphosphatase [Candidatus Altiarchaeota archaeon]